MLYSLGKKYIPQQCCCQVILETQLQWENLDSKAKIWRQIQN